MKRLLVAFCTVAVASLAASCTQKSGTDAASTENVAVVDGRPITRSMFNEYISVISNKPAAEIPQQQREALLDNLIRAEVIAAVGEKSGLDKSEQVLATMELSRLNSIGQAVSKQFREKKPTEAELRAEYDERVKAMSSLEYRASHILVPTEDAAKKVIAELKTGGNFAQIARRVSTDTSNKDKGGDLDWFVPQSMTPPFAEALTKLKKGETSSVPVQTEFGWHVIWVMDTRAATPPPYDAVKEQLGEMVENKKFKLYIEELMAKAKITKSL
jgi:peptidyl-prolyl cis-trans isomerase C